MPFITKGKTNFGYILFVAVIAIIAGGFILGYYYFWIIELEARLVELEAQLLVVKLPEKTLEDEIVNWKTYRNEEYGFEIKYPENWYTFPVNLMGKNQVVFSNLSEEQLEEMSKETDLKGSSELINSLHVFKITIIKKQIEDFFKEEERWAKALGINISKDKITIGSYKGYRVGGITDEGKGGYSKVLTNQGRVYLIDRPFPEICMIEECEIYSKILSTFKFLETTEEFCGSSTNGSCVSDSDCIIGGCSGQVCQSKNEEGIITTCEYKDCYSATNYGFNCKCTDNKCQWAK